MPKKKTRRFSKSISKPTLQPRLETPVILRYPLKKSLIRGFFVLINAYTFLILVLNPNTNSMTNPSFWAFIGSLYITTGVFLFSNFRLRTLLYKRISIASYTLFAILILALIYYNLYSPEAKESSQRQLFYSERYISGIILPDMLVKENGKLIIKTGANKFGSSIAQMKKGIDAAGALQDSGDHNDINLKLRVVGNELLVSSTFRDLEHYEVVGELVDNKLRLLKDKILDYKHDDKNLEVIDRSGNVIFRLSFKAPDTLQYYGYYSGLYSVCVTDEQGTWIIDTRSPNYKNEALKRLENLHPIFKYP